MIVTTRSEAETAAVGRALAEQLNPDDVLLLSGDLGAGKTAFVRGLAHGLGLHAEDVTSPTFTLIQEYRAPSVPLVLYHADLYRLTPREVDDLGLDELSEDGILAVEWPERWRDPPAGAYRVQIDHLGGDRRGITILRPINATGEGEKGSKK